MNISLIKYVQTVVLFVCMFIFSTCLFAKEKITIGVYILEPHVILDSNGEISGAGIDFFKKYIQPELNVDVEWSVSGLKRVLKNVENGTIDMGQHFGYNPDRATFALFPNYSYTLVQACFIVLKDHPLKKFYSIDNILPYTVGYHLDSFHTPSVRDKRIKWRYLAGNNVVERNLKKLKNQRIEMMYRASCNSGVYTAVKLGMKDEIRVIYLPDKIKANHIFSKKRPMGKTLVAKYNLAMEKLIGEDPSGNNRIYEIYNEILQGYLR